MFRQMSISTATDVAAIRAVLASADPAGDELDAAAAARLADIRQAISCRPPAAREPVPAGQRRARSGPAHGGWLSRPGQRRRAVITSLAIPVLLAASAAGWAIGSAWTASRVTNGVSCYGAASLDASATIVPATGQDPARACARYWAAGVISGTRGHHVPSLAACVLPDGGAVGVFPDTTCAALRLQPLPRGFGQAARRFSALSAGLAARFGTSRCVHETVAVGYVKEALRQHGLSGWHVAGYKPVPDGINGPCATFSADSRTHTIHVEPAPGQGVEAVSIPALNRPSSACAPGSTPEIARRVTRELEAALRAAGYGRWKVVIANPASRAQPCYSAGYDPATHQVSLSSYAGN